jgi:hypothetical protein
MTQGTFVGITYYSKAQWNCQCVWAVVLGGSGVIISVSSADHRVSLPSVPYRPLSSPIVATSRMRITCHKCCESTNIEWSPIVSPSQKDNYRYRSINGQRTARNCPFDFRRSKVLHYSNIQICSTREAFKQEPMFTDTSNKLAGRLGFYLGSNSISSYLGNSRSHKSGTNDDDVVDGGGSVDWRRHLFPLLDFSCFQWLLGAF